MSQLSKRSLTLATICQNWSFYKLRRIKYYEKFKIWFFSVLSSFASRLFFFVSVFISCSFDLVCFFAVISNWEALGYFSDWQQISLKSPTMRLTKVRHGRLNRQNRNKMGEDRQRKLTANHQQFNNWIKQIISFLTSRFFYLYLFLFRVLLFCFVFSSYWQLRSV